jgi:hypothetical protein
MAVSRLVVYPYKMGSRSAKNLAEKVTTIIGAKVRRVRENGRYKPRLRSVVLNWGNARFPHWLPNGSWLNKPDHVVIASNKLSSFVVLQRANIPIPEFTTNIQVAKEWSVGNHIVLARTLLNSHSGRGIHICRPGEALISAPLYVKYIRKQKEFRVHVFNGTIIDGSEKRRVGLHHRDEASHNSLVRNHDNGWVFCRDSIQEPSDLRPLAIASVAALRLNFGACDIIWNEKQNKCYTLEVNTAPGLEGTTLDRYAAAVANYVRNSR